MSEDGESEFRAQILEMVEQHFLRFHKPRLERPFEPGVTPLNYGGRWYGAEEMKALVESALDFHLTTHRYCRQLERDLSRRLGMRFSFLVNSGSSANLLAFHSLTSHQLGERAILPGDEVITVATAFPTTVAPIVQAGAVPVFVDVTLEDGTYNIDVSRLEEALSPRTRAVMLAHTLGNPFDLDAVGEFCRRHQLWLVEDNCDGLGSLYRGRITGSFGDVSTCSFFPAHHITTGEGGAVFVRDGTLKRVIESMRDWGRDCWCEAGKDNTCGKRFEWQLGNLPEGHDHKYTYSNFGFNLKMTEMQAAIGCEQMHRLDHFVARRRENWQCMREALADLEDRLILPQATEGSEPSWFGFLLTVRPGTGRTRNALIRFLEERKIQTRLLFSCNLLRHPLMRQLEKRPGSYRVVGPLDNADRILHDTLWLGVYPGIESRRRDYMMESIREFFQA